MNQTEVTPARRGRPTINVSRRIEQALLSEGEARAGFGGGLKATNGNPVTEINARMRLYNAARRVGVRIRTEKVTNRGRYIRGVVVSE